MRQLTLDWRVCRNRIVRHRLRARSHGGDTSCGIRCAVAAAPQPPQPTLVIPLWPEGVPLAQPNAPAEHVEDGRVYNVNVPTLTLFVPPAGTANGTAAIVCPGRRLRAPGGRQGRVGAAALAQRPRRDRLHPQVPRRPLPAPGAAARRAARGAHRPLARRRMARRSGAHRRLRLVGRRSPGGQRRHALQLARGPHRTRALDKVSGRPDFIVLTYPVITMRPPTAHGGSRTNLIGAHPSVESDEPALARAPRQLGDAARVHRSHPGRSVGAGRELARVLPGATQRQRSRRDAPLRKGPARLRHAPGPRPHVRLAEALRGVDALSRLAGADDFRDRRRCATGTIGR